MKRRKKLNGRKDEWIDKGQTFVLINIDVPSIRAQMVYHSLSKWQVAHQRFLRERGGGG